MTSRRRRILAGALTCLGSGTLVIGLLVPGATAQVPLDIYQAKGRVTAVEASVRLVPLTVQPADKIAVVAARSTMSALPSSDALASVVFPGELVHGAGAAACGGDCPGTSAARYPEPKAKAATLLRYPAPGSFEDATIDGRLTVEGGHSRAEAVREHNRGRSEAATVTVAPARDAAPVVVLEGATATAETTNTGARIEQVLSTQIDRISIADGLLVIDNLRTTARAATGGGLAEADGSLSFGAVTAMVGGVPRQAEIRADGVTLTAPELSENVRQNLEASFRQTLGEAGIRIARATDTEIDDDEGIAEASVGGLIISVETGAVPVHGDQVFVDLSVGAALASVLGVSFPSVPPPPPPPTSNCPDGCLVEIFTPTHVDPQIITREVPIAGPPVVQAPPRPTHLVGLVARLPSVALVVAGAMALVLAVGTAVGPSLRR